MEEEFAILKSHDVEALVNVRELIHDFVIQHESQIAELRDEIDNLYTPAVAQYTLELASRIRTTYHAPVGWKEGYPLVNALPPAPQPEQMRIGLLAKYNNSEQASSFVNIRPSSASAPTAVVPNVVSAEDRSPEAIMRRLKDKLNAYKVNILSNQEQDLPEAKEDTEREQVLTSTTTAMEVEEETAVVVPETTAPEVRRRVVVDYSMDFDYDDEDEDGTS